MAAHRWHFIAAQSDDRSRVIAARDRCGTLRASLQPAPGEERTIDLRISSSEEPGNVGAVVTSELWSDLRPSEAARLSDLLHEARERLNAELLPQIIDVATAAGLRFAAEYPDAPHVQPVSAT